VIKIKRRIEEEIDVKLSLNFDRSPNFGMSNFCIWIITKIVDTFFEHFLHDAKAKIKGCCLSLLLHNSTSKSKIFHPKEIQN